MIMQYIGSFDVNHDNYITFADLALIQEARYDRLIINQNEICFEIPEANIITEEDVINGITNLSEDYELAVNEGTTYADVKAIFMPYMKEIVTYITGEESSKVTDLNKKVIDEEPITINGFGFVIKIVSE